MNPQPFPSSSSLADLSIRGPLDSSNLTSKPTHSPYHIFTLVKFSIHSTCHPDNTWDPFTAWWSPFGLHIIFQSLLCPVIYTLKIDPVLNYIFPLYIMCSYFSGMRNTLRNSPTSYLSPKKFTFTKKHNINSSLYQGTKSMTKRGGDMAHSYTNGKQI